MKHRERKEGRQIAKQYLEIFIYIKAQLQENDSYCGMRNKYKGKTQK